jgi:hypothetical protein
MQWTAACTPCCFFQLLKLVLQLLACINLSLMSCLSGLFLATFTYFSACFALLIEDFNFDGDTIFVAEFFYVSEAL